MTAKSKQRQIRSKQSRMKTQKIFLLTFAFLALTLFFYNKNNEDLIFKSDFYLQDDNLSELPSSFKVSGDVDFLTPNFNPKINRYLFANLK